MGANNDAQRVKNAAENSGCQQDANAIADRMGSRPQRSRYGNANAEQLISHTAMETVADGRGGEESERWTNI